MIETSDQAKTSAAAVDELDINGCAGNPGSALRGFGFAWLLWSERRFIGRIAFCGTLLAIIIALLIPNEYTCKVTLMPPNQNSASELIAVAAANNALSGMAADLLGAKSSGALFVSVLQSRTVQDALVNRFDLRKVYREKYYLGARNELAGRTDISEDRRSGIITLAVTDRDKLRVRDMGQAYVDELNRTLAQSSTSSAHRERAFLEERLKKVKQELDDSARALAEFSGKHTLLDPKDQSKSMIDAAVELQAQLIAAQTELHGLQTTYTDQNVRVRAAQARVRELQRQVEKISGKPGATVGEYPSIRQIPALAVPYADLYRRNKVAEMVFELMTQQHEMAKLKEAKDTPTVQLLDLPAVPEKKSGPQRSLLALAGLFGSLLFGMSWVIGERAWQGIDPRHPGKALIIEIATKVHQMPVWRSSPVLRVLSLGTNLGEKMQRVSFRKRTS